MTVWRPDSSPARRQSRSHQFGSKAARLEQVIETTMIGTARVQLEGGLTTMMKGADGHLEGGGDDEDDDDDDDG